MANPKFKQMLDYTSDELEAAIQEAISIAGGEENFWTMVKGIDAYFEKRKRRWKKQSYGEI